MGCKVEPGQQPNKSHHPSLNNSCSSPINNGGGFVKSEPQLMSGKWTSLDDIIL